MNHESGHEASLWTFATRVYSQTDVEMLSLEFQEKYNANVNILLWTVWLQQTNIRVSKEVIDDVIATVDAISHVTVNRLRRLRRDIKSLGTFTKVQAQMINKQILNAELAIEKVLLHRLQDMTIRFYEVMPDKVHPLSLRDYLDRLEVDDSEDRAKRFLAACKGGAVAH